MRMVLYSFMDWHARLNRNTVRYVSSTYPKMLVVTRCLSQVQTPTFDTHHRQPYSL